VIVVRCFREMKLLWFVVKKVREFARIDIGLLLKLWSNKDFVFVSDSVLAIWQIVNLERL